jgi:hypothetical protein
MPDEEMIRQIGRDKNFIPDFLEKYPDGVEAWMGDSALFANATSCPTVAIDGSAVHFGKKSCSDRTLYGFCWSGSLDRKGP